MKEATEPQPIKPLLQNSEFPLIHELLEREALPDGYDYMTREYSDYMPKETLDKFCEKFGEQLREIEEEMELIEKSQKKFVKGIKNVDEDFLDNPNVMKSQARRDHDEHAGITPDIYDHLMDAPMDEDCLLYTSPSPRDQRGSRMPSSA